MEFIKNNELVVLDIETTGIQASRDKILELYMLKVLNGKKIDEYYSKFNPLIEIPYFISNLTGIYNWDVSNAPTFDLEIDNINNFIKGKILIGHNLKFDLSFLKYNSIEIDNDKIDTLDLSRSLLRNKVKNHKLATISRYFNTTNKNEHNAKADVLTTYEVFENLINNQKLININNLVELNKKLNSVDESLKNKFKYKSFPHTNGVYLFSHNDSVQYVGKSKNLRNRLNSHLSYSRSYKSNKIVTNSNNIKYFEFSNELLSLLAEHRLINYLQPRFNKSGKISKNIYWVKLKTNKNTLEISKINSDSNTFKKFGPFVSYSKAKSFKSVLNGLFPISECRNKTIKSKPCDFSILKDKPCACLEKFDQNKYLKDILNKFENFFFNLDLEVKNLSNQIRTYSDKHEYETAQVMKEALTTLNEYRLFQDFYNKLIKNDEALKSKLENLGCKIYENKVEINEFNNIDKEISKNYERAYSEANFYNELLIILRFLRIKEDNRITI